MLIRFLKELYQTWISERPNQLAAALAYYSIFSFAPIIFVAVSIVELFLKQVDPASQLFMRMEAVFGVEISLFVQEMVSSLSVTPSSSSILVSIVSFLALLYAASGLFFQLQYSLNTIWHVPPPQKKQTMSFLRQRVFSFLVVIGIGLVWVFAIFANLLLAWFGSILERLLGLGSSELLTARLVAPLVMVVMVALIYKLLPETKIAWRDVWLGAVISTVLILIAIILVSVFLKFSSISSALQATGAFAMLLVGFYYAAQIFLLGAVCCRLYAELHGSRRPEIDLK